MWAALIIYVIPLLPRGISNPTTYTYTVKMSKVSKIRNRLISRYRSSRQHVNPTFLFQSRPYRNGALHGCQVDVLWTVLTYLLKQNRWMESYWNLFAFSGPTWFLRICRMVIGATFHPTALHLPPIPLGCDSGWNLENQLQGTSWVSASIETQTKLT